ncbi:MAG: TonB-dependent receptor [Candidatus Marinimicrobia bacterium]|jgi:outer membrane receptor for ferrienterochelin and colicins|nr:TonB-dependent receptor [Candidatus Neomarinimicrobiota bacterium]MBT3618755.1 TonB-dependent receptor [Candidatus Neomarinimicrobiota bacterium]MBT3828322.1 TonB-dependent receptor [Candidatus Neomarinimicrobiota bacterium]MBT3997217.1 TonB-dependent receptor [Candidatus Neomarinimicrobiota bacterium]MBT4280185.1 TonB-dependent receptor [Candidatus Neomarinimicrobiota bacterium]
MIFRRFILLTLIIISSIYAAKISGTIIDKGTNKVIPNVNISVLGTSLGAVSDPYGKFHLNLDNKLYALEFSMIGFKPIIKEFDLKIDISDILIDMESTILEFDEINVQGVFSTRLGYESVDIISKNEIIESQKNSISDILRTLPGVDVQFAHSNGRNVNVSIRGSSDYKPGGYNNRVLVLLDGFPIQIPNSGAPDWNSLPLESVRRIEIDNSPASAQYGHNSMGGVINLITDHKSLNNILRFSGGAFNTGQIGLTHGNQKGNWNYGFNIMARSSEGHRFNADDKITRVRTFARYGNQKGRSYRLSHIYSYSDVGHPGFSSIPSYRKSKRISQYVQGHGFYPIKNGVSMSHSVYINKFDTHYYDRDDATEKEGNREYDDLSIGLRSEMLITKWARWIFMTGTDVDWSRSKVSVFNPIYDSPIQLSLGGFIQTKYSIGNGWSLGSGLRYDYRRSDPGGNYQKRIYKHWSPKINLMYTMKEKRAFTIAYSEGFRAPSLSELYLNHTSSYGLTLQGNPSVLPEKVQAFEVMYEHPHSKSWYWSVSVFRNRYENMIDFVYNVPVRAVNRKGVTGFGGEYQFKWSLFGALDINGNYSYLNMSDRSGDPILYRSEHRGQIHISYSFKKLKFRLGSKAWSKQLYEDFLSHDYESVDGKIVFPIRELPATIIPEIIFSGAVGSFQGSIRISNLSDTKYELIQDFPMPGRTWYFTLTKKIKEQ